MISINSDNQLVNKLLKNSPCQILKVISVHCTLYEECTQTRGVRNKTNHHFRKEIVSVRMDELLTFGLKETWSQCCLKIVYRPRTEAVSPFIASKEKQK